MVKHRLKVVFRVDSSLDIGVGHLMRCLALANAMKNEGWDCLFICRNLTGGLSSIIQQQGFSVVFLDSLQNDRFLAEGNHSIYSKWLSCSWQTDAEQTKMILKECASDLLVVDHYALNVDWEHQVKPFCKKLMVIDDLAERSHFCDLLLDQTLGRTAVDYVAYLPENTRTLTGTQFSLLRPEFAQLREYSLTRREQFTLKKILITMGGVDQGNATGRVLEALLLSTLPKDCRITLVMGATAPFLNEIKQQIMNLPWLTEIKVNAGNMAELMADADLAIGAAGSTSWERCCLGLPTLMVVLADNQEDIAVALEKNGAVRNLGNPFIPEFQSVLIEAVDELVNNPSLLSSMSYHCQQVTDGHGLSKTLKEINELMEL